MKESKLELETLLSEMASVTAYSLCWLSAANTEEPLVLKALCFNKLMVILYLQNLALVLVYFVFFFFLKKKQKLISQI